MSEKPKVSYWEDRGFIQYMASFISLPNVFDRELWDREMERELEADDLQFEAELRELSDQRNRRW